MRILITGCNGFVARNLATYLSRNHTVISTNRTTLDVLDEGKVSVFLDVPHSEFVYGSDFFLLRFSNMIADHVWN